MEPSTTSFDVVDPRGWLKAVPQMYRFCSDPKVREAVELGDGFKLHKALKALRKNPMFAQDLTTLNEILNIRRLFLHGGGAPSMFTLNGVGTKIYGKSDEGSDGTYITTLFFTFLFIPIIPIKQYLVRHEGGNRYGFYGSVPSSDAIRVWQWLSLGGPVAMVALLMIIGTIGAIVSPSPSHGGASAFSDVWGSQSVYLVNGLDVPLKVSLKNDKEPAKSKSWKVQANGHELADMPTGKQTLTISSLDDVELGSETVDVPDSSFVAYNIFGAAPIYAQGAIYTENSAPLGKGEQEPYQYYTGEPHLFSRTDVTYPFSEPPKEMTLGKYESRRTVWYTGTEKGGWKTTLFLLAKDKKDDQIAKLAESVLLAEPEDDVAQGFARVFVQKSLGVDGMVKLGEKMVDMWPNSLQAHRFYQDYAQLAGHKTELVSKYKDLYEKDHGAWMGYLYARVAPVSEAMPLFTDLVQKHPKEPYLHRGYGWLLFNSGKYQQALDEFQESERLDPQHAEDNLSFDARALVALGRADEAAKLVEQIEDKDGDKGYPTLDNALLYGQLAALAPGKTAHDPDYYLNKRAEDSKSHDPLIDDLKYGLIVEGQAPKPADLDQIDADDDRDAFELQAKFLKDPNGALKLARELPPASLQRVEPVALTTLALEATRVGDEKTADKLFNAYPQLASHRADMAAYVKTGKESPELQDIDLEWQAAAKLVRARSVPKKQRAALVTEARKADVLHGLVTHAAVAWAE